MQLQWLWLIVPGGYLLISTFFLCFPIILHKRKRYAYEPFNQLIESPALFCIGHRGGGFQGPENTMELFRSTAKVSHMFELDICVTKDNQLVVHHDANLRRTCGVNKDISELNYEELPRFKEEFEPFGRDELMKTEKNAIPLLETLFKEFPEMPMNIDLKTPTAEAIKQFDRLVRRYHREHITIWGSMKGDKNTEMRELNPQVISFYSPAEILKVTLLCMVGLLPFVCLREGVLDIPFLTSEIKKLAGRMGRCAQCLVITLIGFFNLMSRLFIPHLRKRGIITFYWIINQPDEVESAISTGCSGIMTDTPSKLARQLKSSSLYFQGSGHSI